MTVNRGFFLDLRDNFLGLPAGGDCFIGVIRLFIPGLLFLTLAGLFVVPPAVARPDFESTWIENQVRSSFFQSLTEQQRLELLNDIEQSSNFTDRELGARYRWGYIPADREPPATLGYWWESLGPREQDRLRLAWYRNNHQQLAPDRAARFLGLESRLYRIQREYEQQWQRRPDALEEVQLSFDRPAEQRFEKTPAPPPVAPPAEPVEEEMVEPPADLSEAEKPEVEEPVEEPERADTEPPALDTGETGPPRPEEPVILSDSPVEADEAEESPERPDSSWVSVFSRTDTPVEKPLTESRVYWSDAERVRVIESLRPGEEFEFPERVRRSRRSLELEVLPPIRGEGAVHENAASRPEESAPAIEFSPPPIN